MPAEVIDLTLSDDDAPAPAPAPPAPSRLPTLVDRRSVSGGYSPVTLLHCSCDRSVAVGFVSLVAVATFVHRLMLLGGADDYCKGALPADPSQNKIVTELRRLKNSSLSGFFDFNRKNCVDRLKALMGKLFFETHQGFISQEMEKLFPSAESVPFRPVFQANGGSLSGLKSERVSASGASNSSQSIALGSGPQIKQQPTPQIKQQPGSGGLSFGMKTDPSQPFSFSSKAESGKPKASDGSGKEASSAAAERARIMREHNERLPFSFSSKAESGKSKASDGSAGLDEALAFIASAAASSAAERAAAAGMAAALAAEGEKILREHHERMARNGRKRKRRRQPGGLYDLDDDLGAAARAPEESNVDALMDGIGEGSAKLAMAVDDDVGLSHTDAQEQTFTKYEPSLCKSNCLKNHPDELVETSSLASVRGPDVSNKLRLPSKTLLEGLLTDAQLEVSTSTHDILC